MVGCHLMGRMSGGLALANKMEIHIEFPSHKNRYKADSTPAKNRNKKAMHALAEEQKHFMKGKSI